ncbi:MAG: crotonase/enoyl-CoA hydratase family protein [Desulfobacterales bacterium]|nr:crotonase/enoyl-CoA hydratase family protein [Desulfobacterales bacterium]MCP4161365.1 crotonase/enoyl-CoA hydratase family protein [Deltaproteobacteria bacterium]
MSKINVYTENNVQMIGINRPEKRNAFDLNMYGDIALAYGELNENPDLRCGLLYAEGDHFTGGLDLTEWAPLFSEGRFPDLPAGSIDPLGLDEDNRLKKPVVVAVQGLCYTIGIELILATDIRVASKDTIFSQLEIKRGIYPVGGATVRMIQEIGWGNAMRYLLTADEITADEAYRVGLVQELTKPGSQKDKAMEIATTISKMAPLGVQATLASARLTKSKGDKAAIERLLPDLLPIMKSEDFKEGIQSFIERREANFKGV